MLEARTLVALFGALVMLAGCPTGDDDDDADDDVADDDAADDDAADDDVADDDDDDTTTDDDVTDDDDTAEPMVTATVTVPAGFDAEPVSLYVGYLDGWDAKKTSGDGLEMDDPPIGDGKPMDIVASQDGLVGEFMIVAVVYVEGGTPDGEGWPTEGVDYAWYAEDQILGADTIDLGTILLTPYEPPPR